MISGRCSVHSAQYHPTRGLAFEMRSCPFLEEGRVIVLVYSGWPIDSYSTTLLTLPRLSPSLSLFYRDRRGHQRVSTSRPLFYRNNVTFIRLTLYLDVRHFPLGTTHRLVHLFQSTVLNVEDLFNIWHSRYHDSRTSSPPLIKTSPPILFLVLCVLYYSGYCYVDYAFDLRREGRLVSTLS